MRSISCLFVLIFAAVSVFTPLAQATDYTSSSFILRDPVVTFGGIRATSTSFRLYTSLGQTVIGANTSTSFRQRSGFLYFPTVSTGVVSATAGNGQVSLSWGASSAALGFTVGSYAIGRATASGGSYTFTNVGNVTSSTVTGLTNGITYYFVVRTLDALSNVIATSAEVSAAPAAPAAPGGGGGGGGYVSTPATQVIFSGRAYPRRTVTILRDAAVAATVVAGPDARFEVTVSNLSAGNYIFSVYSEDQNGVRSSLLTFPVSVTAGTTTRVSGIFLAPTIDVDKSEVKRGDPIAIFGQSAPASELTIEVNSPDPVFVKANADADGVYLYDFSTTPLELGDHLTRSRAALANQISPLSRSVGFIVGTRTVEKRRITCGRADLNCDGKVNLVDFSIAAYWYQRPISEAFALIERERLNGDGKVDLVDFSIMAFYWTG